MSISLPIEGWENFERASVLEFLRAVENVPPMDSDSNLVRVCPCGNTWFIVNARERLALRSEPKPWVCSKCGIEKQGLITKRLPDNHKDLLQAFRLGCRSGILEKKARSENKEETQGANVMGSGCRPGTERLVKHFDAGDGKPLCGDESEGALMTPRPEGVQCHACEERMFGTEIRAEFVMTPESKFEIIQDGMWWLLGNVFFWSKIGTQETKWLSKNKYDWNRPPTQEQWDAEGEGDLHAKAAYEDRVARKNATFRRVYVTLKDEFTGVEDIFWVANTLMDKIEKLQAAQEQPSC